MNSYNFTAICSIAITLDLFWGMFLKFKTEKGVHEN